MNKKEKLEVLSALIINYGLAILVYEQKGTFEYLRDMKVHAGICHAVKSMNCTNFLGLITKDKPLFFKRVITNWELNEFLEEIKPKNKLAVDLWWPNPESKAGKKENLRSLSLRYKFLVRKFNKISSEE